MQTAFEGDESIVFFKASERCFLRHSPDAEVRAYYNQATMQITFCSIYYDDDEPARVATFAHELTHYIIDILGTDLGNGEEQVVQLFEFYYRTIANPDSTPEQLAAAFGGIRKFTNRYFKNLIRHWKDEDFASKLHLIPVLDELSSDTLFPMSFPQEPLILEPHFLSHYLGKQWQAASGANHSGLAEFMEPVTDSGALGSLPRKYYDRRSKCFLRPECQLEDGRRPWDCPRCQDFEAGEFDIAELFERQMIFTLSGNQNYAFAKSLADNKLKFVIHKNGLIMSPEVPDSPFINTDLGRVKRVKMFRDSQIHATFPVPVDDITDEELLHMWGESSTFRAADASIAGESVSCDHNTPPLDQRCNDRFNYSGLGEIGMKITARRSSMRLPRQTPPLLRCGGSYENTSCWDNRRVEVNANHVEIKGRLIRRGDLTPEFLQFLDDRGWNQFRTIRSWGSDIQYIRSSRTDPTYGFSVSDYVYYIQ
jgi:hypothetical protein